MMTALERMEAVVTTGHEVDVAVANWNARLYRNETDPELRERRKINHQAWVRLAKKMHQDAIKAYTNPFNVKKTYA